MQGLARGSLTVIGRNRWERYGVVQGLAHHMVFAKIIHFLLRGVVQGLAHHMVFAKIIHFLLRVCDCANQKD